MAEGKINKQEFKSPDALIRKRTSFLETLKERVKIGKDILEKPRTIEDLKQNEQEYNRWNSINSEFLKNSFNNEQNSYKLRYDGLNKNLGFLTDIYSVDKSVTQQFADLKDKIRNKIDYLETLVETADMLKSEIEPDKEDQVTTKKTNGDNKNVFIVHGHDRETLQMVARTLEKLGLDPLILAERANAGRTLIEKFEANAVKAGFAIILLTGDDFCEPKSGTELQKRSRQNVILELGYFLGKLGRDKVLPLFSEGVELPSDIHGLGYTPLDHAGNWKFELVKELQAAKYDVDANKLLR